MGQFALGLRSLLIKATIFVVMAALLAWALGGTLWPRPHVADLRASGVSVGDAWYYWSVMIADRKQSHMTWRMVVVPPAKLDMEPQFADDRRWSEGAGPVAAGDTLYYGGCDFQKQWHLLGTKITGPVMDVALPDRLAVDMQLARLAAGLPPQDAATIQQELAASTQPALHPATKPADEH